MFAANIASVAQSSRTYDVCVIGAGPAGITLAMRMGARGFSVLLLEAGPMTYSIDSQALYEGDVYGKEPYSLTLTRLRYFGGTSNHWGGWTRYLETYDFRNKVAGVDSEWPIQRRDLDPYAKSTNEILELNDFQPDQRLDDNLNYVHYQYSTPVKFGLKYHSALQRAENITVVLEAPLTNIVESGGEITAIEVQGPDKRTHRVSAKRFVLCAGGIENSRLLLWANAINNNRIVKEPTALGRYWMEHPHYTLGEALISTESVPWTFDQKKLAYLCPSLKAINDNQILNCALRLHNMDYEGAKAIVSSLACVAPDTAYWASEKLKYRLVCGTQVRANWEQAPQRHNRVTLGDKRDALGIARVDLHWEYSDLERRTAQVSARLFADYLAKTNTGRLRLAPWLAEKNGQFPANDEVFGNHQMGGTRMSVDPRRGVVDANLKIHGLANFYVCGSSVFPSAGQANPTYTIVQLASRLADHLSSAIANPALLSTTAALSHPMAARAEN